MYSRICPRRLSTDAASGQAATMASPNARADSLCTFKKQQFRKKHVKIFITVEIKEKLFYRFF